jgi:hypothetical protein
VILTDNCQGPTFTVSPYGTTKMEHNDLSLAKNYTVQNKSCYDFKSAILTNATFEIIRLVPRKTFRIL